MNLSLNKAPLRQFGRLHMHKKMAFSFFCIIVLLSKESSTDPWLREKDDNFSVVITLFFCHLEATGYCKTL